MCDIIHCREKTNPLTILVTVGHSFGFLSSCVNLKWPILLQANPRPYGIQVFFGVNGVVTKLKCFIYINARMAQSVLCHFERLLS